MGQAPLSFLFLLKKQETLNLNDAKNALQQWKDSVLERRQDRRLEEMSPRLQKVLSSQHYVTPDSDLTIKQQKAIKILRGLATRVNELSEPQRIPSPAPTDAEQ